MTHSTADANRRLVLDLFAWFAAGDIDAAFALLHPEFVSHNPRVAHDPSATSGAQAFADFFRTPAGAALLAAGTDIRRVIADDELVAVHNRIGLPSGDLAAVDIFRVRDGLVAEHWDVVQPVPEQPANPHGMF
ncbi:nuclear transport factor 2 family protein [Goodfellowiella coeruleoviolacea]|uniref:SnoaL-like aldol condensation-catalyzing enzyme n=1 Tax=Goodfellowiella coeruleoviolacea TaxID=334858 RepID=A0AAE3KFF2_9PSEU|nr:nuclear transport factor 2 family protein [Goodfellowiella coeruleoviolacea]MCP2164917.1 putative SnoaL-like aldol condensation-catalyzing enzyme [Goodfellowiella coeruleoviolacea]